MSVAATVQPLVLAKDEGVTDLWWPHAPEVGRYTFKTTGEHTEGRFIQLLVQDRRGASTPLHVHRDADETFYVIEGEATIVVGDERIEAKAGDFVFGPMGVPHAFVVTSERLEMLVTVTPGPGRRGRSEQECTASSRRWPGPVVAGEAPLGADDAGWRRVRPADGRLRDRPGRPAARGVSSGSGRPGDGRPPTAPWDAPDKNRTYARGLGNRGRGL